MSLYLHRSNHTKLLRRMAAGRCKYCGTPIEWFERYDTLRIPLSPEFPAHPVPQTMQWHLFKGVAYPGKDPLTGYCRIPHPAVCPAAEHPELPEELQDVVARLAARMRGRIDRGEFVPYVEPVIEEQVATPDPEQVQDLRHVISYYGTLRLAPCEVHDLQCISTNTRTGQRCENGVFDLEEGKWEQVDVPYAPGRQGQQILALTGGRMWAWVINDFNYLRRWWKQQCVDHFGSAAPDHVTFELVQFHPLLHDQYILTKQPEGYDRKPVVQDIVIHDGPTGETTVCASPACWHSTMGKQPAGWRCWNCERLEKRRARTHRKWTQPPSTPHA